MLNLTITKEDLAKQQKLIDLAKTEIRPEAGRVAKSYDKALIKKYVSEGMTQAKAEKAVSKRRNGILVESTVLRGRDSGFVTVGQILANPESYLTDSFIDPDETETGTNYRAKLMWCENSATDSTKVLKIRSFAGGETFYRLEATKTKPVDLVPLDQPIPDFVEIAPHTEIKNKNVILLNTRQNFELMLRCYGVRLEYDIMRRKKNIFIPDSKTEGDLKNDADISELVSLCNTNRLNPSAVDNYLNKLFADNEKNHVLNFIKGVAWDGIDRLPLLFETITLAHQTDYNYGLIILKTWLIQCVAAADSAKSTPLKHARAKYESVLIFVSSQGGNKTDWFESLTPEELRGYFSKGQTLILDDKDSRFEATSFWIVELGELDATFKKSDIAGLKAFLSLSIDSQRRPYDKVANDYTRRTSFCGTVNNSNFLHDVTGNRRYLPLEITHCNKDHDVDMGQVWAQVWVEYLNGAKWWFDKDDAIAGEVLAHQRGAMNHDPIIEEFIQWYGGEPTPDDSSNTLPFKKFTVKGLIQAIRGDKVLSNGTHVECTPSVREVEKLRAYLNERGFKPSRINGVMKYVISQGYNTQEFERKAQQRQDLQEKQEAEVSKVWGDGEPY